MREERIQGTSRRDEEKHLEETLAVVHENMEAYGRQVRDMQADIDEMLEHYHDNDVEVYTILSNTITMHDHMKRALMRNEKALNKPYFGRIIFRDFATGLTESLYIGRGGISRDTTHQQVTDWRAPVAGVYYENGLGKCAYSAPDGSPVEIDLKLKRTYEIARGKLLDYFDSEVISNDELLTKYLARNKQAVLGEIVATIQKEQNEIIRRSPYHNIIVQGVAGSGKTTVAMHRISFILYNYAERFRPEDFYIVGSNRILLNYITGVLPDLDVYGVRQMTMEQLFVRLLYEDWDDKKYRIKKSVTSSEYGMRKGEAAWFEDLKKFCDALERQFISTESIYLNPKQFVEGIENGKNGVYDRSTGNEPLIRLVDGEAVERYLSQNPNVSIQSKINMLNDRLIIKIRDEFLGKGIKYTEEERKAILRAYRNRYGGKVWKYSTYQLYRDFLLRQEKKYDNVVLSGKEQEIKCERVELSNKEQEINRKKIELSAKDQEINRENIELTDKEQEMKREEAELPDKEFDVYDLAAMAYIYKRTKETEVISEAHHIVIDEAQDFGMMIYHCLHACINGCTYTVMGDISQNIHFGVGLNDWEPLRNLILTDSMDHFDILKKSYRNTVEISNFATKILRHGRFYNYPVEPIIRHGREVHVQQASESALYGEAAEICRDWQKRGLITIAIICRDTIKAKVTAQSLAPLIDIMETDLEKAEFGNGIMVLPVEYTKGLEFDAVLIWNPTREEYPVDDGHAKLLYVAATRALHELCILHIGNLTGLITDPVQPDTKEPICNENQNKSKIQINKTAIKIDQNLRQPDDKPKENDGAAITDKAGAFGLRQRPKARAVIKPSSSTETPAHVKPMTSYVEKAVTRKDIKQSIETNRRESAATTIATTIATTTRNTTESASINTSEIRDKGTFPNIPAFGSPVPAEKLRLPGHSRIDLSIRWISKKEDGLHLQSRYGILRLKPITGGIIRVTFAKGGKLSDSTHPLIAVNRLERFWTYKDSGASVELTTDELVLQADKSTGYLRYYNRDKKLLLSEREKECRQIEDSLQGTSKNRLFLKPDKKEQIFSVETEGHSPLLLRGDSRYITPDNTSRKSQKSSLPFLFSDRGWGLLIPADGDTFFCDTTSAGTFLCTEGQEQMDMYFISGKDIRTLENACKYLYGRL